MSSVFLKRTRAREEYRLNLKPKNLYLIIDQKTGKTVRMSKTTHIAEARCDRDSSTGVKMTTYLFLGCRSDHW